MKFILIFLCLFALGISEEPQELPETQQSPTCNCSHVLSAEKELEAYPKIPATSFTCWNKYDGYYADVDVDCTIFHYCQTWHFPTGLNETVKWDFACPEGTIFNQKILSCTEPGVSFECKESPDYFWVNYILTATPNPAANTNCNRHRVEIESQSAEFLNSNDLATGSTSTQSPIHFENMSNTVKDLATDSSFSTDISHQQNSETGLLSQEGSSSFPLSPDSNAHTYLPFSSSSPQEQLFQNTKETPDSYSAFSFTTNHFSQEAHSEFFTNDVFQSFPESVSSTSNQKTLFSESVSPTENLELNINPSEHSAENSFEETQETTGANLGTNTPPVFSDRFSQIPTITYQQDLSNFFSTTQKSESNFQATQSTDISVANDIPNNEITNSSSFSNFESDTVFSSQSTNSSSNYEIESEESEFNSSAPNINKESNTQQPEPLHFSTETNESGSGSHQNEVSQLQSNEDYTQNNPVEDPNTAHNIPTEHNFPRPSHDFESEVAKSTILEHSIVFPPSTPSYDDYYSNSYPQPTHGPGSDPIEFPSANSFPLSSRDNEPTSTNSDNKLK